MTTSCNTVTLAQREESSEGKRSSTLNLFNVLDNYTRNTYDNIISLQQDQNQDSKYL